MSSNEPKPLKQQEVDERVIQSIINSYPEVWDQSMIDAGIGSCRSCYDCYNMDDMIDYDGRLYCKTCGVPEEART